MTLETVQLGNEGIKVTILVKKPDGSPKDLTGATNLKIKVKSVLAAAGKSKDASIEGSPADGAVSCILSVGDIDALSTWRGQAYYEQGSFKGHTKKVDLFYVEDNLA